MAAGGLLFAAGWVFLLRYERDGIPPVGLVPNLIIRGDALTAVPLGAAFLLRSDRAERSAGLVVVLTILASALTAGVFAVERIINPLSPDHLLALALADQADLSVAGVAGNGREALEAVAALRPQVLLLDLVGKHHD